MDNQSKQSTKPKQPIDKIRPIESIHPDESPSDDSKVAPTPESTPEPTPESNPESTSSLAANSTNESNNDTVEDSVSDTATKPIDKSDLDSDPSTPRSMSSQISTNSSEAPVSSEATNQVDYSTPPTTPDVYTDSNAVNAAEDNVKPRRKKGPIICFVCFIVVLLAGSGFAAAYFIANQPANIIASSLGNLLSAKQAKVDGSINISLNNSELFGIESVSINLDEQYAPSGNSTTANLEINYADNSQPTSLSLGEAMLENGVLYLKAEGVSDYYDNNLYEQLKESIISNIENQYMFNSDTDCYSVSTGQDEITNCYETYKQNLDPQVTASAETTANQVLDQVGQIVDSIDRQWLEISIDDVLNSDILSFLDSNSRQSIADSYECTIDKINHFSNYSSELSDIYNKNQFITMVLGQDSFYNISFNAEAIAGYLNAMPQTKLVKDLNNCLGASTTEQVNYTSTVTAKDIQPYLEYVPRISAKFDGIFNHHLTELKINEISDVYSVKSHLKFTYPSNINISAPSNSRPIMDLVEEIYQQIQATSTLYTI